MGFKTTTMQCLCCQKVFYHEYGHGGAIEHENMLRNMHIFVSRWDSGYDKDALFLDTIELNGNHRNVKNNRIKVGREIFKCVLIWMQQNGREDIYGWLKSKEHEIVEKYNDVRRIEIGNLKRQIEKEQAAIV